MNLTNRKVLVVDDNPFDREIIERILLKAGATVFSAADGQAALRQFFLQRPELVLLDRMMPVLNGRETCEEMQRIAETPIVIVSALADEASILEGLEIGAADYITKPFRIPDLLARVNKVLSSKNRPRSTTKEDVHLLGNLQVDVSRRTVHIGGEQVYLSHKEFHLLLYFLENRGKLLTTRQILHQVWGWECQDHIEYVHVIINRLRQKLERNPLSPPLFVNAHGVGYQLVDCSPAVAVSN